MTSSLVAGISRRKRSPEKAGPTSPSLSRCPVAAARTAQLTRAEVQAVLLDGFFPECGSQAHPYRTQAALKEWGLPYASDSAVTRHLADFLRGRPRVDAILFNGGSLYPAVLRQRICQQVRKWQGGLPPLALENADLDLSVARGGATWKICLSQNRAHRGGCRPRGFPRSA